MQPSSQRILPASESSFNLRDASAPEGFAFDWHQHPECELTLVLDAVGTRYVGDRVEAVAPIDLVLLGANVPHTWHCPAAAGPPPRAVVLQFTAARLLGDPLPPEYRSIARLLQAAERGLAADTGCAKRLAPRLLQLRDKEPFACRAELLDILHALATETDALRPLSHRAWNAEVLRPEQQRIDRVCGYVNENFRSPLRLAEIAGVAGMSEAALCRAFKRATGRSVMKHVNALRITHALSLLRDTDQTIAQIAYDAGFSNLANFNRRFREIEGRTPTAYRQSWKR